MPGQIRIVSLVFVLASTASGWCCAAAGQDEPSGPAAAPANEPLIFARDVQPIFQRRCIGCHGSAKQHGGLRLDRRSFAEQGGDSGIPLLEGGLGDNELLRRVTSDELGHRMPLEGPPLADNEIAALRSWVAQGAPWPETGNPSTADHSDVQRSSAADGPWWLDYTERGEAVFQRLGRAPHALLVVLLVGLAVGRIRRRWAAASGPPSAWSRRFLAWTAPPVQLLVVFSFISWGYVEYVRSLQRDLQAAQQRLANVYRNPAAAGGDADLPLLPEAYFPPLPEKSISPTYYRGNDERSPELFNGGFYRTATFRLNVCDSRKQPLDKGSPIRQGPLYVRLEIERAPLAAEALFTAAIMKNVVLSKVPPGREVPGLAEQVVRLETVRPMQSWVGYFPIEFPSGEGGGTISGMFYVCQANVLDNALQGSAHYQVEYDLAFADGKLTGESNLAMGSLFRVANLQIAQPGMIQHNEWFDSRPIPVIAGENSSDPKLLGVDKHIGSAATEAESTVHAGDD